MGESSPRSIRPAPAVEGEIKNITEFGLFIGLDGDVDGMVHLSDLDWKRPGEEAIKDYKKSDLVKASVLDVDIEKERISLGIKQVAGDPMEQIAGIKKGDTVTCEVVAGSGERPRGQDRRHRGDGLHQAQPTSRATAPNSGRSASPSAKRSMRG